MRAKWDEKLAVAQHEGYPECFANLDLVLDSAPFLELIGEVFYPPVLSAPGVYWLSLS